MTTGGLGVRRSDDLDIKLFILVGWGRSFFLSVAWPTGVQLLVSFAPVFQWCCSTPQGSPLHDVGRHTLCLSSPHLCFIIVFICHLFVSRDNPLMS